MLVLETPREILFFSSMDTALFPTEVLFELRFDYLTEPGRIA
jgi:hypothetical protein